MRRLGWQFWTVVVLIIAGMAFASLLSGDDEHLLVIREAIARVEQRCKEPESRTGAVYGELTDGEAWQHYDEAVSLLSPHVPQVSKPESLAGNWRSATTHPAIVALRESLRPAMAAVRAGAHCRLVARGPHNISSYQWSCVIWLMCAEQLAAEQDVEAVELWLDGMAMTVDADIEYGSVEPFVELWTDDRLKRLSATARERLSQGLTWIDAQLAKPNDWEQGLMPGARMVCRGKLFSSDSWLDQLMAWDSGFSPQRRQLKNLADGFRNLELLVPPAEQFRDRLAQFDAFEAAVNAPENHGWLLMRYRDTWRLAGAARIRLLQVALSIHSGLTPKRVPDPLGNGAITVLEHEGEWRLSSGKGVHLIERTIEK